MTEERRCLFCVHMHSEVDNPAGAEREFQMRFGPEVALVVGCGHPEHRSKVNTLWCCKDWEPLADTETACRMMSGGNW